MKAHKDTIENIQRKYSYKKQRRQRKTVLNHYRTGRKTSMSPLTGECSDGACRRDHSNTQSAQSSAPSFQEIVTMTMAAVSNSKDAGKGTDRGRSPGSDKPNFWFEPDCSEFGANGHRRPDCQTYRVVLSKNNGERPKGHKDAFEKAREEHRHKSRDSKGKGKERQARHSRACTKPFLPNEELSDDLDCERPDMALKSLRTAVFALRRRWR